MVTADMKSRSAAAVLPKSSTSSSYDKTEWLEENVLAMLARPSLSFETKDDEEPNLVTRFSQPALPVKADGGGGGEPYGLEDLGPGAVDGLAFDFLILCIFDFLVTVEVEMRLPIDEEGLDKGREVVERDRGTGKGELGSESLPMECL